MTELERLRSELAHMRIVAGDDSCADYAIRNAKLVKLANSLLNNVRGLDAFEHEIREVAGNTNWAVIQHWVKELTEALNGEQP